MGSLLQREKRRGARPATSAPGEGSETRRTAEKLPPFSLLLSAFPSSCSTAAAP